MDPLRDFPDVVPDFILGPSLLFGGQPAHWVENSTSHGEKVGISSSITFEALAGEKASSALEVVNNGSTAVWYEWRRLTRASSLGVYRKKPHVQQFYFNTSAGVILPGETKIFPFHFKSQSAGIFSESWEFCTHPVLLDGALIQLYLWGIALYEDKMAPQRIAIQRKLEALEAKFVAKKMVQEILDEVRSPEHPQSPVMHMTEEDMFHLQNPKLHYKYQTVQELHQLWKDCKSSKMQNNTEVSVEPEAPDILESHGPPAENETTDEWNLSVVDLKQASNTMEDDAREAFLANLMRYVNELTVPPQEAPVNLLHQAFSQLWREALDKLAERSKKLHMLFGMPDKTATTELVIPETELDPKQGKESKDDKKGGLVKEDRRTAGAKEKDEKKGGRFTRLDKLEKEEQPSSRKSKSSDNRKLGKPVPISMENKEMVSSGESLDVTPPESQPVQMDPVIQEKYRERLYTELYGIMVSMMKDLGLIAEDSTLNSLAAEEGSACSEHTLPQ